MPVVPVVPGARSAFGIGLEGATTPGTAVAATRWAPWSAFNPVPKPTLLIDDGMRGSMGSEYGGVMGPEHAEGDFSGPFTAESTGDLLYNILGGYSVAAPVSTVYPHTVSLLNSGTGQPRTHTLVDFQNLTAGTGARSYPYVCLSELTFSGNAEGLALVAGKFSSTVSAPAAGGPTNAPTADQVIPAWRSTLTIGGAAAPNLVDWSVTISRVVIVQPTADGIQAPYVIARGPVTVAGKYTFVALDESPLTSAVAGTKAAHVLTIDNGGATTAVRKLALTMTQAVFTDPQQKRDTLIGWDVGFKGLMNATDAGASGGLAPIKAVLNSAIADYSV